MKKFRVIFAAVAAAAFIFCGLYFFVFLPKYTAPIFTYHRIGYGDNSLFVTPENFDKQMKYLKDNGFKVVSLDKIVDGIKNKRPPAFKSVAITIDDGYEDNFINAYPILKKYGFPATIFLVTNDISAKDGFLKWDEINVMAKNNIAFGAHTRSHIYIGSPRDKNVLRNEIAGSKEAIEKNTGLPVDYFCYPVGGFCDEAKSIVKKVGYKAAFTTNRGFDKFNKTDVYELKRIKITNSDTNRPFSFWAKLSGYYNFFRKTKAGHSQ